MVNMLGRLTEIAYYRDEAKDTWLGSEALVRAILTELREPSDALLAIGEAATFEWMAEPRDYTIDATRDGWKAVIDAILGGKA